MRLYVRTRRSEQHCACGAGRKAAQRHLRVLFKAEANEVHRDLVLPQSGCQSADIATAAVQTVGQHHNGPAVITAGPHDPRSCSFDRVGKRPFSGGWTGRGLPILHQSGVKGAFDRVGQHLNIGAVPRAPVAKGHNTRAGAVRQRRQRVRQGSPHPLQPALTSVPRVVQAQRLVEHHHDIGPGRQRLLQKRGCRGPGVGGLAQIPAKVWATVLSLCLRQATEQGQNQHEQPDQHSQQAGANPRQSAGHGG